jgi:rRNA processing protein Krr1/Pno1
MKTNFIYQLQRDLHIIGDAQTPPITKTAIQELIEELKANDVAHGMYWIKEPNNFFEKYLEKEKKDIINTYWDGYNEGSISSDVTAQEYYDKKYQNK